MKIRFTTGIFLISVFLACLVLSPAGAQMEEELQYSYGTVKSISSEQIVLDEYDYYEYKDIVVTYTIGPEVRVENVDSLKEIEIGDEVDIEYITKERKRIVKNIYVYKELTEDVSTEEDM